uniref:MOK protein kinase n=1 Tax=Ornithorhynchus anatinus TaxID=9258 RepID=A0A6I8PNJ5_ORNAN
MKNIHILKYFTKMQSLRDGTYYACKQMKQHFESIEQVNNLREIQAMRRLNPHPNILTLHEVVFDRKTGSLALICELMDMNIYELIRGIIVAGKANAYFYLFSVCTEISKASRYPNFYCGLLPICGCCFLFFFSQKDLLKLGDFGSCRSVYSRPPYTEYISTRWYRAPECLLTDGYYSSKMDMWSAGCVFYEISSLHPLFPGANELDQITKIHEIIGTPAQKTLTKFKRSRAVNFDFPFKKGSGISLLTSNLSPKCLSLISAMVEYDPDERISAKQALRHSCFREQRLGEKQLLAMCRKTDLPEHRMGPESASPMWRCSKEARKQQTLKQAENHPIRQGPTYPVELPKLNVSGVAKLTSYSSPSIGSVFSRCGVNGKIPKLKPLKCTVALNAPQEDLNSNMKQFHLPTIGRKGGEY